MENKEVEGEISLSEEGLLKHICPKCGIIVELTMEMAVCPLCGLSSGQAVFNIYPPLGAIDLLYSLLEISNLAKHKQKEIINKIIVKLEEKINKKYDYNTVSSLLVAIIKTINREPDSIDLTKKIISKHLKIDKDGEVTEAASHIILSGDNINRLYKAIVILSASCIEITFKDYMLNALVKITDSDIANNIMGILTNKSIDEHTTQLNALMKKNLKDEMEEVEKGFFDKWETLRKERNKLIHKNSIQVHSDRVTEIFKLAKKSVHLFMELNNKLINTR